MHKKLASDLTSLAHSILQMKNKDDVFALKEKAYQVYEKLSVLAYVEEYINTTPNSSYTKEELLEKVKNTSAAKIEKAEEKVIYKVKKEKIIEELKEEYIEQPFEELEQLFNTSDNDIKNDMKDVGEKKTPTLEEELKDTVSVDAVVDLFEKVESKSLNNQLQTNIQIGLNDRIAFVKHLFDGNQGDFNRVISQLNTFKTEKEAKKFINKTVKPDYNWSEKGEYETRLFEIIERRFN